MGPKLQCTKDYGKFEVSQFNRDVVKTAALEQSMKTHGYIQAYPLHCVVNGSGKLTIKAGHHRFEVAKKLGIAVWYVLCEDNATIHDLEGGTNPWKFRDFIASFVRTGSDPHIAVVEFSRRTGINLKQSASLLANESAMSGNQNERIKKGTYAVKDTAHAELVGRIVMGCRERGTTFATASNFVGAVSSMARLSEFDADVFLHRIEVNSSLMRRQATMAQYQELIEAVYNHKSQLKIPLAFMAREESRKRCAVKRRVVTEDHS